MRKNKLTCLVSVFNWHTQVEKDEIIESMIALGIRDLILHHHVECLLPITCLVYLLDELERSKRCGNNQKLKWVIICQEDSEFSFLLKLQDLEVWLENIARDILIAKDS